MKRIILFISILSVTMVCYLKDKTQDLGDSYYYLPLYEAIDVGFPDGAIIYKGPQKYHYSEVKIKHEVISVKYDKEHILAIQRIGAGTDESHSSIAQDHLRYYIIEKKTDIVYGPYTYQEYLQRRDTVGVSNTLKLRDD